MLFSELMNKILIITIFLSLLIIAGCKLDKEKEVQTQASPNESLADEDKKGLVVCNKPYLLVGRECCLDKDDNSICDKDEIKPEDKQFYISGAIIKEECGYNQFSTLLTCESYKVTPRGVELTLLWESAKTYLIKEISVVNTNCSNKWDIRRYTSFEAVEGGVTRGDRFKVKLECEIKEQFLDTKIKMVYDVYQSPSKNTNLTYGLQYEGENMIYFNIKKYLVEE